MSITEMIEQTQSASNLKRIVSDVAVMDAPSKRVKVTHQFSNMGPSELARRILEESGSSQEEALSVAKSKFIHPTSERIGAYTMEVSKAVRDNDLDQLKELHAAGARLDCCNKFGDSLIAIACRRSHTRIVKFLLEEANVPVHFVDDLQRTPLHDACWTSQPNFEVVELLLKAAPEHAYVADKRGHTPFDYTRSNHVGLWVKFLSERKSLLVKRS